MAADEVAAAAAPEAEMGHVASGASGLSRNLDRLKWLTASEQRDFCKGATAAALQDEAKLMKDFRKVLHLLRSANEHCILTSEQDPEWNTEDVQASHAKRIDLVRDCIEKLEANPPDVPPDIDITVDAIKGKMYSAFASTLDTTAKVSATIQDSEKLQGALNTTATATSQLADQAEKAGKQLTDLAKGALFALKGPQPAGGQGMAPSATFGGGHVPYDPPTRTSVPDLGDIPVALAQPMSAAAASAPMAVATVIESQTPASDSTSALTAEPASDAQPAPSAAAPVEVAAPAEDASKAEAAPASAASEPPTTADDALQPQPAASPATGAAPAAEEPAPSSSAAEASANVAEAAAAPASPPAAASDAAAAPEAAAATAPAAAVATAEAKPAEDEEDVTHSC